MARINLLNILKHQVKNDNLSHAYLVFEDFRTDQIAATLRISIADLLVLEESPIKINHVRGLIHWLSFKPHSSPRKLAIIFNVENLILEAANALLKLLEEPPLSAIIILKAARKEKILPTILSRCQIIKQKNLSAPETIDHYLSPQVLSQESILNRFKYLSQVIESENTLKILNLWENDFRLRLQAGENVTGVLKQISRIRSLHQSNVSLKLLLENLLLQF